MRRPSPSPWLIGLAVLVTAGAVCLRRGRAADNYTSAEASTAAPGGGPPRSVVFRSTDLGGVQIPHVFLDGVPQISAATIWTVQTSASDGAAFVPLPALPCTQVRLLNLSGVTVEVRRGGAGAALPVPDRASYVFRALSDSAQLSVRRTDLVATPAVLNGEAER